MAGRGFDSGDFCTPAILTTGERGGPNRSSYARRCGVAPLCVWPLHPSISRSVDQSIRQSPSHCLCLRLCLCILVYLSRYLCPYFCLGISLSLYRSDLLHVSVYCLICTLSMFIYSPLHHSTFPLLPPTPPPPRHRLGHLHSQAASNSANKRTRAGSLCVRYARRGEGRVKQRNVTRINATRINPRQRKPTQCKSRQRKSRRIKARQGNANQIKATQDNAKKGTKKKNVLYINLNNDDNNRAGIDRRS